MNASRDGEFMSQVPDHDLLIEIKTSVSYVLSRMDSFVTRGEFEPYKGHATGCEKTFATKEEMRPVKAIAYTLVSVVGITVIGAVLKGVIQL